jgi:hypothetical protein
MGNQRARHQHRPASCWQCRASRSSRSARPRRACQQARQRAGRGSDQLAACFFVGAVLPGHRKRSRSGRSIMPAYPGSGPCRPQPGQPAPWRIGPAGPQLTTLALTRGLACMGRVTPVSRRHDSSAAYALRAETHGVVAGKTVARRAGADRPSVDRFRSSRLRMFFVPAVSGRFRSSLRGRPDPAARAMMHPPGQWCYLQGLGRATGASWPLMAPRLSTSE